jgi:2-amino-4-deoxychorismate synthase
MSSPARAGLLERILGSQVPAFALLHRPESGDPGIVDVLAGDMSQPGSIDQLPLPDTLAASHGHAPGPAHELLAVIPYRQVAERGYAAPDDEAPLLAMQATEQARVTVLELLRRIPDVPLRLSRKSFDIADDDYADLVRHVIAEEIGGGVGANFVIKRTVLAKIGDYSLASALAFFLRLLRHEQGAYWTFLIHTGQRTFIGASPERHLSLNDGIAVMNPISGTYRYPKSGATFDGIIDFLNDRKEVEELYMVLDEELKMMARICDTGGRVTGPRLREMARLAHTEYFISGRTHRDVREMLRETLFAPTVTGSPVESATRVIKRYEPDGRGYYSGIAALIGRDAAGKRALDSAILIRTAEIDDMGHMRLGVGATVVRGSNPPAEAAETKAKAAGLLAVLESGAGTSFSSHPAVREALSRRNTAIAGFWLDTHERQVTAAPAITGAKILVIDAEDTFTAMLGHQLTALGAAVTISRFDEDYDFAGYNLTVLGPGPGDPQADDPKMEKLRAAIGTLLSQSMPFIAVCLSHQVLSSRLGFELVRLQKPHQGEQREIDFFGSPETVGFYNTFSAYSADDERDVPGIGQVRVSRDPGTGEVFGLSGTSFLSMQFHAESVLTIDGPRILANAIREVLG